MVPEAPYCILQDGMGNNPLLDNSCGLETLSAAKRPGLLIVDCVHVVHKIYFVRCRSCLLVADSVCKLQFLVLQRTPTPVRQQRANPLPPPSFPLRPARQHPPAPTDCWCIR